MSHSPLSDSTTVTINLHQSKPVAVSSSSFFISTIDSFPLKIVKSKSQQQQQQQANQSQHSSVGFGLTHKKNDNSDDNWCPGGGACSKEFLSNGENRLAGQVPTRDEINNHNYSNHHDHQEQHNNNNNNNSHEGAANPNLEDMDPNTFGGHMSMMSMAAVAAAAVADANHHNEQNDVPSHADGFQKKHEKNKDHEDEVDDDDFDDFMMERQHSTGQGELLTTSSHHNEEENVTAITDGGFSGGFGDAAAAAAAAVAAATAAGFSFGNFVPDDAGTDLLHHGDGDITGAGGAFALTSSFGLQERDDDPSHIHNNTHSVPTTSTAAPAANQTLSFHHHNLRNRDERSNQEIGRAHV